MLANVGGVACSYFEWLKNLDHVAPGRMNKRQSELDKKKLIELLGYIFPKDSPVMKHLDGASEIEIVNSALEEIMVAATEEHWKYAKKKNYTLREACLGNSLQKLASRFEESGMLM
jgi:glutamate dehydrogenase (NAD(P)+)